MATTQLPPLYVVPRVECAMCKVLGAKFVCATCGTFYCNVPCQVKHWPTHKGVCMPRLMMATSLMGTAIALDQYTTSPVTPNPPNKPNEKTNNNNCATQQPAVANGSAKGKSPSNEVKANQQKAQPVIKSTNNPNPQCSTEQKVERNGQIGAVGAVIEKSTPNNRKANEQKPDTIPKDTNGTSAKTVVAEEKVERHEQKAVALAKQKPEPISKNANGTNIKTGVAEQKVEEIGQKALATPKPPSKDDTPKQQKEKQVLRNVNNINTDMMPITDAGCKNNTARSDSMPDGASNGKLLQYGPFPEPGSMVKISYVADDMIYIYQSGTGPNGETNYIELQLKRALECARSVKHHLSVPPSVDDIVFADYDGEYFRAVVKSVKNEIAEVFYPDFGNSNTVRWNTLKEIPDPKIKYANCLTHGVWIDNIATFTPVIKDFLRQLENEAILKLIAVIVVQGSAGIRMVEMYHCEEKYNLSWKLLNLQKAFSTTKKQLPPKPKSPVKTSKFVVTNPKTYKPVQVNELIDTDVIDGKGIELVIINASNALTANQLYVVTKSNYTQYKEIMKECQVYGEIDQNPYVPKDNEVFLVKENGIWYRAVSIEPEPSESKNISKRNVMVYLLDIGSMVDEDNIQIRRYPPGLTRKQLIVDGVLENTNFLLDAMGGNKDAVDTLCGKVIKADINLEQDEDIYETMHITILTIGE